MLFSSKRLSTVKYEKRAANIFLRKHNSAQEKYLPYRDFEKKYETTLCAYFVTLNSDCLSLGNNAMDQFSTNDV